MTVFAVEDPKGCRVKYGEVECGMSEWQDISTAPKTGEVILLFEPATKYEDDYTFCGRWHSRADDWYCTEYDAIPHYPTHWQPLPGAPK